MSNYLLKFDKGTLIIEDNSYGDIAAPVNKVTFDNDYIHIWHDL